MRSKKRSQTTNAQTGNRPAFLRTRLSKRNASERHIRAASRTEAREIHQHSKNSPSGLAKCQAKRSQSDESTPPEMFQMKRKLTDEPSDCRSNDSKQKKKSPTKRPEENAAPSGNSREPQQKGGQAQKRRKSFAVENLSFAESPVITKSLRSCERGSAASESITLRIKAENSGSSSGVSPKSSKSGTEENDTQNKDSPGSKSAKKGTRKRASSSGSPSDAKESVKIRKKDSGNAEIKHETATLENTARKSKKEGKNTVEIKTEETSTTAANPGNEAGKNVGRILRKSSNKNEVKLKEKIQINSVEGVMGETNNNRDTNAIEEANRDVAEVRIKENRSIEVEKGVDNLGKLIKKNTKKAGKDIVENRDEGVSINTKNTIQESTKDTVETVKEGAYKDGEGLAEKEPRESNKTDEDSVSEKSKCMGDKTYADLQNNSEGVSYVHQVEKNRAEKTLESEARMNLVYSSAEKVSVGGGISNSSGSCAKSEAAEGREKTPLYGEMEDPASPARQDSTTENKKAEKGDQTVLGGPSDRRKDSSTKVPEKNQPGTHGPKSTSCEKLGVPPVQNHAKSTPVAGKCKVATPKCTQEDKDDSSDKADSDVGTSGISERSVAAVQSTSQSSLVTKCSQLPGQPSASTSSQKQPTLPETPPTPAEVSVSL